MDLVPDEGFKVRFKVIGISLKFDEKREVKKSEKQRKRRIKHPVQLLRKCMKALSIKALNMDIDTDDVVLNAQLIPLAFFFSDSKQNRYIHINFEGRFFLYLLAQIRLNLILIAFVKHLLKR
ncbi:MAG: hypothetical protein HEP71_18590 [Roseivirga sp.]|nr:hypothetical protein [Roseivirga sp.]